MCTTTERVDGVKHVAVTCSRRNSSTTLHALSIRHVSLSNTEERDIGVHPIGDTHGRSPVPRIGRSGVDTGKFRHAPACIQVRSGTTRERKRLSLGADRAEDCTVVLESNRHLILVEFDILSHFLRHPHIGDELGARANARPRVRGARRNEVSITWCIYYETRTSPRLAILCILINEEDRFLSSRLVVVAHEELLVC